VPIPKLNDDAAQSVHDTVILAKAGLRGTNLKPVPAESLSSHINLAIALMTTE